MIQKHGDAIGYLMDYKDGRIKQGLGIGSPLDKWIRHKPSEMTIILGHDNVGKTYITTWYFLCLALVNDLQFCLWSGENQKGQMMRDMIQMLRGVPFKNLTHTEITQTYNFLEGYFLFVDNKRLYKPDDLLNIFEESGSDVCLIDPFTGLDRDMNYEANYRFLNSARHFCNSTGKSLYINTHPVSESGRAGNIYTEGDWKGHLKAPLKSHIEGGKSFINRCDNMWTVHRLISHKTMKYYTMISVEKIKDLETGGKHTPLNEPVLADFNRGLGFTIGGVDALSEIRKTIFKTVKIKPLL
tara:strand:- start:6917 stop:7810 length:894 start_codon:yes stop_codon:yes gene_type:complete